MDAVGIVGGLVGGKSKRKAAEAKAKAERERRERESNERREERENSLAIARATANSSQGGMSKQMPLILGGIGLLAMILMFFGLKK